MEAVYTEFNERTEAAISSYSATSDILFIYFGLVDKNHQKI